MSRAPSLDTPFVSDLVLEPADNDRLANLCGQFDEHLKQIERRLGVEIRSRGNRFQLEGPQVAVNAAQRRNLDNPQPSTVAKQQPLDGI